MMAAVLLGPPPFLMEARHNGCRINSPLFSTSATVTKVFNSHKQPFCAPSITVTLICSMLSLGNWKHSMHFIGHGKYMIQQYNSLPHEFKSISKQSSKIYFNDDGCDVFQLWNSIRHTDLAELKLKNPILFFSNL